jgi:3-oxoacyl-[acyl-carrier-protein] synthase II
VRGAPRRGRWDAAVANSFGFGGHNVSLVFTRA